MGVKPPQRRALRLLEGLVLLTTAEFSMAEAAVANAVTVVLTHHARGYTPSTAEIPRDTVEERVFPFLAVAHVVENDLMSFAGKAIPRIKMNELLKGNFDVKMKQHLDNLPLAKAIDELIEATEDVDTLFCSLLVLIWFGTKSPEDQEVAIALLAAKLGENARTRLRLLTIFQNGKEISHFCHLAAAVEREWVVKMTRDEAYKALELSQIQDNKTFLKRMGLFLRTKFQHLNNEEVNTLMLTKMRGRSKDEIMWARLIYKLVNEETVEFSFTGVFDLLLRSYNAAAGNCRPIEAVEFLAGRELSEVYKDVALSSKKAGAVAQQKLLERSNDELMWAKLIYMLQNDESVHATPSNVFDALLQPYDTAVYGPHQCTPSQAVKYLTGSEFFRLYNDKLFSSNDADALLLTELRKRSQDELMWAKVVYILQNDESVLIPLSGVFKTLVESWTIVKQSHSSKGEAILSSWNFFYLYMFAQFLSENPIVFVLNKLREQSTNEYMWACLLYKLQMDHHVTVDGLDALLHSWLGRQYEGLSVLVSKVFDALLQPYETAAKGSYQCTPSQAVRYLTDSEIYELYIEHLVANNDANELLLTELRKRSPDELMWAKVLYILQNDESVLLPLSGVLKTLVESWTIIEHSHYSGSEAILSSRKFFYLYKYAQFLSEDPIAFLLEKLRERLTDKFMWARALYELPKNQYEATDVLDALLHSWIGKPYDAAAITPNRHILIDAYEDLMKRAVANWDSRRPPTRSESLAFVENLRKRSKDEVMWAKFLHKLQQDGTYSEYVSSVFDALLQPYETVIYESHQCTPSQAVKYLTDPESFKLFSNEMSGNPANTLLLTELLKRSPDELMWAKVLNMLQNDESMLPGVLETLVESWAIVEHSHYSGSEAILSSRKFFYLYKYAQFLSENPIAFLLEKLRERLTDKFMWARALYKLPKNQYEATDVLDALLHSWIGKPYDAAAITPNRHILIDAYEDLMKIAIAIRGSRRPPTRSDGIAFVENLRKRSKDEVMWAKFLYKLQQDEDCSEFVSSVFDVLLQSYDSIPTARVYTPSLCVKYLKSSDFARRYTRKRSRDNAGPKCLTDMFRLGPDELVWAKVLYILQSDKNDSESVFSNLLKSLIQWWMRPVHLEPEATEQPNALYDSELFLKSQQFVNLLKYAQFSKDNPNVYVVGKLRERSPDEFMWARLLNKLREDKYEVTTMTDLLNTFLYSWTERPYEVATTAEDQNYLSIVTNF